jgi:hypothetical protein
LHIDTTGEFGGIASQLIWIDWVVVLT